MRLDYFIKNLMLVLVIGISSILDISPVFAQEKVGQSFQETSPKCWALDVVVIVDMSGSMRNNDPDDYRFDAVEEVIYELASNKQEECLEANHRVGLITFSSEAIAHIKLKSITVRPDDDTPNWVEEVFGKDIAEAKLVETSDTSFEAAFDAAEVMFKQSPEVLEPEGYGARRQIVIFITDGKPTHTIGGVQKSTESLMCDWTNGFQNDFWKNKSVWILPLYASDSYLDDEGCNKTIRQNFEELATSSGGRLAEFLYNNQTIPRFVFDLIANEFGQTTQKVSCNDVFYVDPYLASVKLSFFSEKNDNPVFVTLSKLDDETNQEIFSLNAGQVISQAEGGSLIYDPESDYKNPRNGKEQYVIYNPLPGKWRYVVDGMDSDECVRNVDGTKIQILPEVSLFEAGKILPLVPEAPYYDVNYPATFTLSLRNSDTLEAVLNDTEYPLEVTVTWFLPSGGSKLPDGNGIAPIELFPTSAGLWESNNSPILTPEIGVYNLIIEGQAQTGDKSGKFTLFRETTSFEVLELETFKFVIVEPELDTILSCNSYLNGQPVNRPLRVTVQLQDYAGNPVLPSEYLVSSRFLADYSDQTGQLDSIQLVPIEDGLFQGILLEGAEIVGCGLGMLTVRFDGEYDSSQYNLLKNTVTQQIERAVSQGVVVKLIEPMPDSLNLRFASTLDACSISNAQPLKIQFSLTDLDGNLLDPRVISSNEKDLYSVRVKAPGSNVWEELDVSYEEIDGVPSVVALGGQNVQQIGKYEVEILPVEYAFSRGYVADSNVVSFSFIRQDNFWTTKLACNIAYGGMVLLGILLLVGIIYILTGGPGGSIYFRNDRGDEIAHWNLSSMRIMTFRKYKSIELSDSDIQYVQFFKGTSGNGIRAVHLKIVNKNGEVIWDMEIPANQEQPVAPGINAEYFHNKHKETDSLV